MHCDICNCDDSYIKVYNHSYDIKGKKIEFKSKRRFCKNCNNLVYDDYLDNEASKKALSIYNDMFGINSIEVYKLRKQFNLSLDLFSRIIGCAKKTLISYEKGKSIPNDCYLIVIKSLIEEPRIIYTLIDVNKNEFTEKEYNIIKEKINRYFDNNISVYKELSEYNGYSNYSLDKIKNIILFFSKDNVLKTKLLKEMFYSDFIYFKNNCVSITGLEYAKLPYGPVPEQYESILTKLISEKVINYKVEYNNQYECHNIKANLNYDPSVFTKEELDVLNMIKMKFLNFGSKELADYSHKEKAYTDTKPGEKISYDYAFDIEI